MCDKLLKSICRLCLKDNFSLKCIFTSRSPSLEPISDILEKIYDLKIYEGDELPSQICVACVWKVLEFDMFRKNVKCAEQEFRNMCRTRSRTYAESNEVPDEGTDNVTEFTAERETNVASDPLEGIGNDSEVAIKNEIEVEEWEMPQDIPFQRGILENVQNEGREDFVKETEVLNKNVIKNEEQQQEDIQSEKNVSKVSAGIDFEHNYPENDGKTEKLEELQTSESCNFNSSEYLGQMYENFENVSWINNSSVVSTSGISGKNKKKCEKSIKNDFFTEKESLFSFRSESGDISAKSGSSSSGMAVQTKRKLFACDVCKKRFVRKWHLGNHMRVHYDDRPFKCRECGQSFKQERVKTVHELRHLKKQKENGGDEKKKTKKSYVCEICKKEFSRQDSLYNHSNLHKNKYSCTFCGKRFVSKTHLNRHLRIHTNEKPFSCEVCKRTFNQKSILKRHVATHSDDCPFQCNVCDKRFKTKQQKNRHELHHLRSK